jgi:hypothetical protein
MFYYIPTATFYCTGYTACWSNTQNYFWMQHKMNNKRPNMNTFLNTLPKNIQHGNYCITCTTNMVQACIFTICVAVQTLSGIVYLSHHSNGDILKQKIIIHLTQRNYQYCATVITKCYFRTHKTFFCIIIIIIIIIITTLHVCKFSIMIISSYLLSKYTNSLTKTPTKWPAYLYQPRNSAATKTCAFFNGHWTATRKHSITTWLARDSTYAPKYLCLPSMGCYTQPPSRTGYSNVHPSHYWRCCRFPGSRKCFIGRCRRSVSCKQTATWTGVPSQKHSATCLY